MSPRKHQLLAAEATALARARGHDVRLLLAGDAFKDTLAYGDALRRRIAEPDLAGNVVWLPFQKDVAGLYRAMDANLLISGEEGFGRTIIEAACLGKPSIGTRIGGIPELIREGETGLLVDEGNAGQLADAIIALATDRERLAALGNAARDHVRAHFTIEAHVARMMEIWREALGQ